MKKKLLVIVMVTLVVLPLAINWKHIVRRITGEKVQIVENRETMQRFAGAQNARYDALCVPKNQQDANFLQKNAPATTALFFNREGNLIHLATGENSPTLAHDFLGALNARTPSTPLASPIEIKTVKDVTQHTHDITGGLKDDTAYDFYIVYTWAKTQPQQAIDIMKIGRETAARRDIKVFVMSVAVDSNMRY